MLHWQEQLEVRDNRVFFRTVNRRLLEEAIGSQGEADAARFFCECGSLDCSSRIRLRGREFRRIGKPASRIVAPGHEGSNDRVLLRTDRYVVVSDAGR
jgi:hypothetical protein